MATKKRKKTGLEIKAQRNRIIEHYGEDSTRGRFARNTSADYEQNIIDKHPRTNWAKALTEKKHTREEYINKATPRVAKALGKIKASVDYKTYSKLWEGKTSARQVVAAYGMSVG